MATARRRTTIARPPDRNRSPKGGLENHSSNSRNQTTYAHARKASWVYPVGFRPRFSRETRAVVLVIHSIEPTGIGAYDLPQSARFHASMLTLSAPALRGL